MADRVYPSARPTTTTPAAANGTFPAPKSQLYGATRPAYRIPAPSKKAKHRGNCCCRCCLWTTVTILVLILLVGIAGTVFYVIYRPHRPTFTVSSLKISTLNLTSSQVLTTNINLNITAKNPNKKVTFIYNPTTITLLTSSDGVVLGTGSVPAFAQGKKNTTLLEVAIASNGQPLDDTSAGKLKADLKSKNGVVLKVVVETKVRAKFDALKLPKIAIRVTCDGIKGSVPSGKTAASASLGNSKCKVDLRFKIWKWTF